MSVDRAPGLAVTSEHLRHIVEVGKYFETADSAAIDLLLAVMGYIKDAGKADRDTIRRLLKGLQSSPEVRTHLVGQLKLIDRLVEAEKGAAQDEAQDAPPRAKAS